MRLALTVAYDGRPFAGFQIQGSEPTVQASLEEAIRVVLRESVRVHCAGRTDAGVHAVGQVVSFDITGPLPPTERLQLSLNALLPDSVKVSGVHEVPADFHARFSCIAREYVYLFWCHAERPVHWRGRAGHLRSVLSVPALNAELAELLGERDWAAFTRPANTEETTFRYIDVAFLDHVEPPEGGPSLLRLRVRGNAFLHNMIRILVGTIRDRGRGRLTERLVDILESRNRLKAGPTASPDGLYFHRAYYPPALVATGLCTLADYPVFRGGRPIDGDLRTN